MIGIIILGSLTFHAVVTHWLLAENRALKKRLVTLERLVIELPTGEDGRPALPTPTKVPKAEGPATEGFIPPMSTSERIALAKIELERERMREEEKTKRAFWGGR